MVKKTHSLFALALASVITMTVGGELSYYAVIVSILLAAIIGFKAQPKYFPALLILLLPTSGLRTGIADIYNSSALNAITFPNMVTSIPLFGADFNAALALVLAATVRIFYDVINNKKFRQCLNSGAFFLWLFSFVPAFLGAIEARELGTEGWSVGIRIVLAFSGLFWGVILGLELTKDEESFLLHFNRIIIVGVLLDTVGLIRGHFHFLLCAFAGAIAAFYLNQKSYSKSVLLLICIFFVGLVSNSGTTFFLCLAGFFASFFATCKQGLLQAQILLILRWCLLLFPVAILFLTLGWSLSTIAQTSEVSNSFLSYNWFMFKLFGDRAALWLGAVDQIRGNPWFVVPAGQPYKFEVLFGSTIGSTADWNTGAHQTVLEILRQLGWLAGLALIGIAAINAYFCSRVMINSTSILLRTYASAILVLVGVSGSSSHYLVHESTGFVLWTLSGLVIMLNNRLIASFFVISSYPPDNQIDIL